MGLDPSSLHEPGTEVLKSCVHFLEVVVVRIHKIVLILHSTVVKGGDSIIANFFLSEFFYSQILLIATSL